MAQNRHMFLSLCRSCRHQLEVSSKQTRTFTSTPRAQKTIPSFTPSANEELDDIFLTFRQKYFTPHALTKHHRGLIYNPNKRQILLNDPGVTVTLSDGEELKLMPMNVYDKPAKGPSLRRIAEHLSTSDDSRRWNNLPAFLEGMQLCKEKLPEGWLEKITRKANELGKTGVIIRCAEMVKKTGLSLSDPRLMRELMIGLHNLAANAGWEGEDLMLAAKRAEQIALMLEDQHHCSGKLKNGHRDMRRDMHVLGTLLELAAAKALHVDGGDVEGKVSSYVKKLLTLWQPQSLSAEDGPTQELENWLPILHGMRLALKFDEVSKGPDADSLKLHLQEAESKVQELREHVIEAANGKPRRGLQMYDKLQQK